MTLHSATDAYLGYAYQGLYALLVLFSAADDESISIETADDVVLEGTRETLHQLKHSRDSTRPLTLRDDGWWKTLAIWVQHYRRNPGRYVFVTCAPVALGDPLETLATGGDVSRLQTALVREVERVDRARRQALSQGRRAPYQRRYAGVAAFASLSASRQLDLLSRVSLQPKTEDIAELPSKVARELQNAVLPQIRDRVTERLIEWWDRRVLLGLVGRRDRLIAKDELLEQVSALIAQHRDDSLPDDYRHRRPTEEELDWGGVTVDQMEFVDAGQSRILRALEAHWRAAQQRERWLAEDISVRSQLSEFDDGLRRAWRDRHGPMSDDCIGCEESHKQQRGRDLLDWSHNEAFRVVRPIRNDAPHDYLTQGTYQLLAQAGEVGWHPEYIKLLRALRKRRRAS